MKLRAIIFGVQEYEESSVDYKSEVGVLEAQIAIGVEDPISFVNPDNVQVKVESVDPTRYSEEDYEYAKSELRNFIPPNVPVEALKDDRLRAHWAAARFHLSELERLL